MKNKWIAPVFALLIAVGVFSFGIDIVSAQLISPGDNPDNVAGATAWGGSLRGALKKIIDFVLFFLGIVATIMVIYGGFLYVTSGGDEAGAEKGKKILMYAAIGIIIVLVSFAVVNTLLQTGTGGLGET